VTGVLVSKALRSADSSRRSCHNSRSTCAAGRPLNPIDAKYLLTGLLKCGQCGGTLEVRSRQPGSSRGRTRVQFYMFSVRRRRGRAVCAGLDVPLALADGAILNALENSLVKPDIIRQAIARVITDHTASVATGQDGRRALGERKDVISRELGRVRGQSTHHERPGYRIRGAGTVEPLISVILEGAHVANSPHADAQGVASPAGVAPFHASPFEAVGSVGRRAA
jgi:hypothetical protein